MPDFPSSHAQKSNRRVGIPRRWLDRSEAIAHIGSWENDLAAKTILWSDEAYRIFGLQPHSEEMTAARSTAMIHPDDRQRVAEQIELSCASHAPSYDLEYRIVWPDDSIRYLYEEALIERNESGEPVRIHGFVQDLTARHRAEEHMLASEWRFRSVLENVQAMAVQLDVAGNITFVNDYLLQLTGWRAKDLLGKSWFALFSPDEKRERDFLFFDTIQNSSQKEQSPREAEIVTRAGETRLVSWDNIIMRDAQGAFTGLTSLGNDITEQRRMEEDLRESEATLTMVTSAVQDAIIMIDSRGMVLFWNCSAERMFGYSREEVFQKDIKNLIIPEHFREQHQNGLNHFRETGEGAVINNTVELPAMRKNGEIFPMELSLSGVQIRGSWYAVGAIRDITERKKVADALRRSYDELQSALEDLKKTQKLLIRSEKLASLGALAAGVAHEIKNPLNIISTTMQLLQMDGELSGETERSCQVVLEQVARASKITENLSDFARERKPEFTTVELERVLDKIISLAEYEIKVENITILRDTQGKLPSIRCDSDQLAQVLLNLINNARDSLSQKRDGLPYQERQRIGWSGEIRITTFRDGEHACVMVKDNGVGIPAERMNRIFDPFYTTKEEGKGTGLGLSLSYGIVERHGGEILVASEEGEGATFTLRLPIHGPRENGGEENV